ncbi:MAG: ABC transporter substrate-binding protein [Chloroflexota bacterium]
MKKIQLLVASVLLILILAACGGGTPAEPEAQAPVEEVEEASVDTEAAEEGSSDEEMAEEEGRSLTIDHELGSTTIDYVPERIVVLEYSFADHLGTLGIAPVGHAVDAPPEYIYGYTSDVGSVEVGTRAEPNLEVIIETNPDFIIGDSRRHSEIYDQLSEIAPTVIFNSLRGSYDDQLEQFNKVAEIVDMEAEAADILADYDAKFAEVQATTNGDAGEFVVGVLWDGGFTAHSNQSFMGSFLESLGRTNALEPQGEETQYLLDMEGFASVNPGAIVVLCNPTDQGLLDGMAADQLWQAFDAVSGNRVYTFDRNLWSKGRGVTAFDKILDDAVSSGLLADGESQTPTCGGVPAAAIDSGVAAATRTIEHALGTSEVPADPQRVVVLDAMDNVIELGIKPVGIANWMGTATSEEAGFPTYLDPADYEGIEWLGNSRTPNIELILELEPDLIIGRQNRHEEIYDQLSAIAPTVIINQRDLGGWKGQFFAYADALNRNEEAEELMAAYDARTAEIADKLASLGTPLEVSVIRADPDRIVIYQEQIFAGSVLKDAGVTRPAAQDKEQRTEEISLEQINLIDGDIMLAASANPEESMMAEIQDDPLWNSLSVVQNEQVFPVAFDVWIGGWTITGANLILDDIETYVLGNASAETVSDTETCEAGFRLFDSELLFTDPICVPEDPQRVAFIDELVGLVPVLGVESVSRSIYFDLFNDDFPNAFSQEQIESMTDIGHPRAAEPETILLTEPDLIISGNYWEDANVFLPEIAPTVIWDWDYTPDWAPYFLALSDLLGKGDVGQEVMDGIDARLASLEAEIGTTDETYVVVRTMDELDSIQVFTTYNFGAEHVAKVGLSMPDSVLTPEEAAEVRNAWWYPLSVEALQDLDADHIFMLAGWEADIQEEFMANPLWETLSAVQNDQVHFIAGEYWVRTHPIASHRIIDDIFTHVAGVDAADVAPNPFAYTYEE